MSSKTNAPYATPFRRILVEEEAHDYGTLLRQLEVEEYKLRALVDSVSDEHWRDVARLSIETAIARLENSTRSRDPNVADLRTIQAGRLRNLLHALSVKPLQSTRHTYRQKTRFVSRGPNGETIVVPYSAALPRACSAGWHLVECAHLRVARASPSREQAAAAEDRLVLWLKSSVAQSAALIVRALAAEVAGAPSASDAPAIPPEWSDPIAAAWAAMAAKLSDPSIPDDTLLRLLDAAAAELPRLIDVMDVDALAETFESAMGRAAVRSALQAQADGLRAFSVEAPEVALAPMAEAVAKLGRKTPVGARLSSSQWADVPVALRERAFFSARVESVNVLSAMQDKLRTRLALERERTERGNLLVNRDSFARDMRAMLIAEGIETTDESGRGTIRDIRSPNRLRLIYDVQTESAAAYTRFRLSQDPDVLDQFPAWRFVRVQDVVQPRDWHLQFEGMVRLKSDVKFWTLVNRDFGVPWGPWGWGCGHDVEDVERDEAEALGLIAPEERPQPADGGFNDNLQASVADINPELLQWLLREVRSQVEIDGDILRWAGEVV